MKTAGLLGFAVSTLASPLLGGLLGNDSNPAVDIKNGTIIGSSLAGVDSFLGIPFALPPTGQLRLRRPQTYNKNFGVLKALRYAPGCIQTSGNMPVPPQPPNTTINGLLNTTISALSNNPLTKAITGTTSEDCLYLNVQRPSTAKPGAKLPVVIWIYGGGFQFGDTSTYNAQNILERANFLKAPVVYVSMAYRLSGFGWMPGKEMQQDGSTNIGLHDQRKAMEWVQENIEAFGGDPEHVVIWGESAGSISVFDHTIVNNGDNTYRDGKPLFHGAVMNSGSIVPARDVTSIKAQAIYDAVADAAGCLHDTSDSLACLRSRSADNFTAAQNTVPGIFGYESVNLPFLPRPDPLDGGFLPQSPDVAGLGGQFARVPVIIGDQQDEGTLFSLTQSNLSTNDQVIDYFNDFFFPRTPRSTVARLVNAYPQNVTTGSPYRTGDFNNIYPQYKRMASILGDITFNLIRRAYLSYVSHDVPAWSYLNSYLHDAPILGTFHGADLLILYGPLPTTYQNPQLPIDYYISFFNYYDPNKLFKMNENATSSVFWPQWKNDTRQMLGFAALNTSVIKDDFRQEQYNTILNEQGKLRV